MENNKKTLTEEELKGMLDLTPENVEKIYIFSTTDYDGKKILSKSEENFFVDKVDICKEPNDLFPPVYMDMHKLRTARVTVLNFLRQLRITFMNKGLSPEDERFKKMITADYARLKICDGTNVTKMNDGTGSMKYATVWANEKHPEALNQLLALAVGLEFIEPLKKTNQIGKNGKPIFAIDTTKGFLPELMPQMSMETKKALEALMMKQMQKTTAPTAPSGQGEDGVRE